VPLPGDKRPRQQFSRQGLRLAHFSRRVGEGRGGKRISQSSRKDTHGTFALKSHSQGRRGSVVLGGGGEEEGPTSIYHIEEEKDGRSATIIKPVKLPNKTSGARGPYSHANRGQQRGATRVCDQGSLKRGKTGDSGVTNFGANSPKGSKTEKKKKKGGERPVREENEESDTYQIRVAATQQIDRPFSRRRGERGVKKKGPLSDPEGKRRGETESDGRLRLG